jgi:phosphatidylethanolamine/phosphatidyl-N-methylethanolamine N-methyltransferase
MPIPRDELSMTSPPRPAGPALAYERCAPVYDRVFGAILEPGRLALAQAVRDEAPATILEVGVGTGLMLAGYPPQARVVGIDVSENMLRRARQRADALPGRHIVLHTMDAEHMRLADARFGCVTLPYVLSVTPDPARLVGEVRRVCRPGGTIFILNHFSGSRFWWAMERAVSPFADRVGFRSDFGFEEQALAHDWTVESVQSVNLLGLSRLVRVRNVPRSPSSDAGLAPQDNGPARAFG